MVVSDAVVVPVGGEHLGVEWQCAEHVAVLFVTRTPAEHGVVLEPTAQADDAGVHRRCAHLREVGGIVRAELGLAVAVRPPAVQT